VDVGGWEVEITNNKTKQNTMKKLIAITALALATLISPAKSQAVIQYTAFFYWTDNVNWDAVYLNGVSLAGGHLYQLHDGDKITANPHNGNCLNSEISVGTIKEHDNWVNDWNEYLNQGVVSPSGYNYCVWNITINSDGTASYSFDYENSTQCY
jgi:hypothetical protein